MTDGFELSTKSKLLKAAITVFSNHGFAGGSVRQIADLAGTNIAAITYHYKSKKQLWQTTFIHLQERMIEAILKDQDRWGEMTAFERVKNTTKNYVRFCARHPELQRITLFETIHGSEMLDWLNEQKLTLFSQKSIEWVTLAQQEGVYEDGVSALHLHFIATHASNSIFLMAPHIKEAFGINVFEEEQIEKFADSIATMFLKDTGTESSTLHHDNLGIDQFVAQ
ncbi:MAG: TetR/AcrR family transcriptional regulator [Erythrobacter sp.]